MLAACSGQPATGTRSVATSAASAAGLVAGYGFGEGAGTVTADASGNLIAGTLVNATWTAGHAGGAVAFNGTTSYVDLGNPPSLAITGSLTLSAWVYEAANVGDDGIIVAKSTGAGGWELKSSPDTGIRTFAIGIYTTGGAYVARYSNAARAIGTWYHVAGVYDAVARTLHVYVNGTLADGTLVGTVPSAIANPATNAAIGRRVGGFNLNGVIDDVRVYGRALSQAEIQSDLAGAVGAPSGDTQPPVAPTNLSAAAASASRVDLSWTASTDDVGVAGYTVFRNGMQLATVTATSYADTNVVGSTPYTYEVSAHDASGNESPRSPSASATTPAAPFDFGIAAPSNRSVAQGGTTMGTVTATLVAGSTEPVTFSASGLPFGATAVFAPAACSPPCTTSLSVAIATSTPVGSSAVTVAGSAGTLARMAVFTLTVTGIDEAPPSVSLSAPASGSIVAGAAVTVSASASDNVGVAGVQFLLDGAPLGTEDSAAPYSIAWNTSTTASGAHLLAARARDAAGNTAVTPGVPVIVDNEPPVGTVVANGGAAATRSTSVTLTLSAMDVLGTVRLMRFSNSGTSWSAPETYATTKVWTLTSGSGTKTVYAQFADGAGNSSAPASDTIVLDTTAPTVSSVAASAIMASSAAITWTTSEPATSQVEYGPSTSYGFLTPSDPVLVTSHRVVLGGLAASTRYYFRVRSMDAAGNEKLGSRSYFTTTKVPDTVPPSVPTGVVATGVSVSRVDVRWTASTDDAGVAGYRVFRNGVLAGSPATATFADTGLAPATTYAYSVAAYDGAGNVSAASTPVSGATLPDSSAPLVPAGLTASAVSARRIDLTWKASTDDVAVKGYSVYRDGVLAAAVDGPSWSDTGLTPASGHGYNVAAFDTAGNASAWSLPASATTFDVVTVTPASAVTTTGGATSFSCIVDDPFDTSCTWSVLEGSPGGAVTPTGPASATYTAPAAPGSYHVVATGVADPTRSSTATVKVLDGNVVAAPMPIVSRFPGVRAFANNDLGGTLGDFGAERARDASYDGWGHYWRAFDLAYPAWVAYDLSAVPPQQRGQVLIAWYNESFGYDNSSTSNTPLAYNEPADYFLEANAAPGGTASAPSTGWTALVSVSANKWHSRTHAVDLTGYDWLRFRTTAGARTNQSGNTDCEIKLEVFDAHLGNTDSWVFVGDSITAGAMDHLEHGGQNFAQRINAASPAYFPLYENAGQPFDAAQDYGVTRLAVAMANSPGKYVALAYGMNDAGAGLASDYGFYQAYAAMVDAVLAAGRIPVIPTISWTTQEPWRTAIGDPITGPTYGLNRQLEKLKADYRAQGKVIVDGPDLWHFFEGNPSLVGAGDIHPTEAGYVAMRHLWADAVLTSCYPH